MSALIQKFDAYIIRRLHVLEVPLARAAIFIVYFWFGLLKLLGVSPAGPLVQALFQETVWFVSFPAFYIAFSFFEMAIGIIFLVRGWERLAIFLLGLHLLATILPLALLRHMTWQGFLIPTLEGQYIMKNVLIIAAAVVVGSKLVPMSRSRFLARDVRT
ncbi:hypothetical protein HY634_00055 [Candidatus Uhrbacteria bacterium]|nr:hypothetical protein [Candidatus Uhrbacteria bacterium]